MTNANEDPAETAEPAITLEHPAMGQVQRAEDWTDPMDIEDEVPAWEQNLARLADGPAADRIVELEIQEDEDLRIIEGLVPVIARLEAQLTQAHQDYRAARERITELEDAPVRKCARRLVEAITSAAEDGMLTLGIAHAAGQLAQTLGMPKMRDGHPATLVLVDETARLQALMDTSPTVTAVLDVLGVPVRPALSGERVVVQETHRLPGVPLPRTRVLGCLLHGAFLTDEGRGAHAVPVRHLAAYIAGVRAAGYPAPTRRREVAASLVLDPPCSG